VLTDFFTAMAFRTPVSSLAPTADGRAVVEAQPDASPNSRATSRYDARRLS